MRYRAAAVVLALAAAVAIGQVPMYSDYPWGLVQNGTDQGPVFNLDCVPPLQCDVPSYGNGRIRLGDGGTLGITLDDIPDGVLYARPLVPALDGGYPSKLQRGGGVYDTSAFFAIPLDTLDAIPEGAVFGRTNRADLDAGHVAILLRNGNTYPTSAFFNVSLDNLDNVPEGAAFGRVSRAGLDAGSVVLDSTLDGTYAKAAAAGLTSGYVSTLSRGGSTYATSTFLNSGLDTLDNLGDGTSFGRPVKTSLDGGYVVQVKRSGTAVATETLFKKANASDPDTLDSVADGTSYARINAASVSSGNFKTDNLVDGTYSKVAASYVDASKRVTTVRRSGADESVDNLFKKSSDTFSSVAGTIASGQFGAGVVQTAALDTGAVTEAKLGTGSVTNTKLGDLSISAGKLQDSAVTTAKLNALAVDSTKLAAAAVTTAKIATGAVTSNELGALAVTTAKIAAGAVTSTELGAAAVTTAKLATGAVTSNELASAAVTTAKIATGAITATELGTGAVTEAKLGAGAVTNAKLGDGAVSKGKLASGSVTPAKLEAGADFGAVPLNGDFTSWTGGSGSPPDAWAVNTGSWGTDVSRSSSVPYHLVFPDTATSGTLVTDDLRVLGNWTSLQVKVYGYAGNGYSTASDYGMRLDWYDSTRTLISSDSFKIRGAGFSTGGGSNTNVETTVSPPSNTAYMKAVIGRLSRDRTNNCLLYYVSAQPVAVLADGSVTSAKLASDIAVTGTMRAAGSFNPSTSAWPGAAFRAQGSYGGALSFVDGAAGYGLWVEDSGGTFAIGQGTTSGGLTERLRINSSGSVGIGTAGPEAKVDVYAGSLGTTSGNSVTANRSIVATSNWDQLITRMVRSSSGSNWTSADWYIGRRVDVSDHAGIRFGNDEGIHLVTGGTTTRLTVASGGNVGIGTTNPDTKLDVISSSSAKLRVADTAGGGGGAITAMEVIGSRPDGNATFGGRVGAAFWRSDSNYIASGTEVGTYAFGGQHTNTAGFNNSNLLYSASIVGVSDGSFSSSTSMPTAIAFKTGSSGSALQAANVSYGTERMRITSSGNVGVGTTSPSQKLEVVGIIKSSGASNSLLFESRNTAANTWEWYAQTGFAGLYKNHNTAGTPFVVEDGGDVGIGTTNPATRLHVSGGNIRTSILAGGGTQGIAVDNNGNIIVDPSDSMLKTAVEDLRSPLRMVLGMRPVTFSWKDTEQYGPQREVGFIAQEMMQVVPEVVSANSNGVYSLDYSKLTAVLAGAIQELYGDRTWLAQRVQALEDRAQQAEDKLAQLEARLAALEARGGP